jgi:hypothetical protein
VKVESAEYYRALAAKMLEQAAKAVTAEARQGFLNLATSWKEMAEKIDARN